MYSKYEKRRSIKTMKKKVLSLLLAMTLVLGYAVPVAATEATVPESVTAEVAEEVTPNTAGEAVSDDPAVQDAYDTYKALEAAIVNGDYAALKEEAKYLENLSFDTDAQQEEYDALVEEQIGFDKYLETVFSAAYIIDAGDKYEAYQANKNANTAYDFVAAVDVVTEDFELSMESFIPGISADYEEAKATYLSDEEVLAVYEAYAELVLYSVDLHYYDEDFFAACDGFEAVLDTFNELTEAQLNDLAVLMGAADAEDAWNQVFSVWANACTIMELGEVYTAFTENPNKETAKPFVEKYEAVFNATDFYTKDDFEQFREFFFDIDDKYAEAKTLLAPTAGAPSEDTATEDATTGDATESDKSDKDTSPETGDDFNAAPYAALMLAAAAVAALAFRRRKTQ
jgi:LPXTG-motif cell wall-anchored protein